MYLFIVKIAKKSYIFKWEDKIFPYLLESKSNQTLPYCTANSSVS